MIGALLFILLIVGFIALTGGTGEKKKTKPPPVSQPTERDKVVEEMIFAQYGGAIAIRPKLGQLTNEDEWEAWGCLAATERSHD